MQRKLLDKVIIIVSTVGLLQGILSFVQNVLLNSGNTNVKNRVVLNIIVIIYMAFIIYFIFYNKKYIINNFQQLKLLVENNKLQTLREVIMLVNKKYEKKSNLYSIHKAEFVYELCKNDTPNYYDVIYKIKLDIRCFRIIKKDNTTFHCYAILDSINPSLVEETSIKILLKYNYGKELEFEVIPQSVTTSGMDHIANCTGLYEIIFDIPENKRPYFRSWSVNCIISYVIKKNILLHEEDKGQQEYNFVIIPYNYGKTMKKCSVEVNVPQNLEVNIAFQRISTKEGEKLIDFVKISEKDEKKSYILTTNEFKPNMNTVYLTHITKIKNNLV